MSYEFKREEKYLVLKLDDIDRLPDQMLESLKAILSYIGSLRRAQGKKDNSYVVVNEDESYAEAVWKLIQNEEEGRYRG